MRLLAASILVTSAATSAEAEIVYDYDEHIAPLLEHYCVDCHGPDKQKSQFRLDSFDHLMTPGSSDEVPIVPYAPMESPLLEYLLMPKSDEYAMPPDGEPTPTGAEILQISQWIYHGAKSSELERGKLPLDEQLDDESKAALQRLEQRGGILQKLDQQSTRLFVDLRGIGDGVSPRDLTDLQQLAPLIDELNLSGSAGALAEFSNWSAFTRLRILNLNHTQLPVSALPEIAGLPMLQRLSLFDTPLADQGWEALQDSRLEALFIGSTGLTAEQVHTLAGLLPTTRIESDWDLSRAEAITEEARHNSATFNP